MKKGDVEKVIRELTTVNLRFLQLLVEMDEVYYDQMDADEKIGQIPDAIAFISQTMDLAEQLYFNLDISGPLTRKRKNGMVRYWLHTNQMMEKETGMLPENWMEVMLKLAADIGYKVGDE
jgi:hypothetical protein